MVGLGFTKKQEYYIKLDVRYGNPCDSMYMTFFMSVPARLSLERAKRAVFQVLIDRARRYGLLCGEYYIPPHGISRLKIVEFSERIP